MELDPPRQPRASDPQRLQRVLDPGRAGWCGVSGRLERGEPLDRTVTLV